MFCTKCGVELPGRERYCSQCGTPTGQGGVFTPALEARLSRPVYDKKIAGVCAGFARYFGVDVTLVRILWVVAIVWPIPVGLIAYIVAWIVMPRDPVALIGSTPAATATSSSPAPTTVG